MEARLGLIWLGLLGVLESTDAITTAMDRARGSIESMPISAILLDAGGMGLFVTMKVAVVIGASTALWFSLRWLGSRRAHARALYSYVLSAIRVGSVAIAIASLNNALLLRSLG